MSAPVSNEAFASLIQSHGPFYLFDLGIYRANIAGLRAAFAATYPNVSLAWSYKTNWIPALLREATVQGLLPEVVSRIELDLAQRMGAPLDQLIFNGPIKTSDDLDRAFEVGATIHVDAWSELTHLERHPDRAWKVGVRCNVDLDHPRGRFGFDRSEVAEVVRRLSALPQTTLRGLHLHMSGLRGHASYGARAAGLIGLAAELGWTPEYIDIGGGFAGPMSEVLASQFGTRPSTYAQYADAIGAEMRTAWPDAQVRLIVEPGMGLVANAARFVCSVHDVKTIAGTRHAVCTGSVYNIKPTMNAFDLPLTVVRPGGGVLKPGHSVVGGYTCMETDLMHKDVQIELEPDDVLVFENCGAYTTVLTPEFIQPAPAILVRDGDSVRLERRAHTIDDWLAPFTSESR